MKFLINLVIIMVFLNGSNIKEQEKFIDELLHYKVELPTIYNPFVVEEVKIVKKRKKLKARPIIKPKIIEKQLELLAILNNKVLVKVKNSKNSTPRWLKVGDTLEGYKIVKILNNFSVLVSLKNKKKILTIKKRNNINIKVVK